MKKIAIINAKRTAIGSFQGSLATLSCTAFTIPLIKKILDESNVEGKLVDEVYMGNVLSAGLGQNPARQSAIGAGIPDTVPASTINTVCGSGLHSIGLAYNSILLGDAETAIAGGMESMTNSPYFLKKARSGYRLGDGKVIDSVVSDGLTCPFGKYHMGITAENIAEEYNITRQEQDKFALESQQKAAAASNNGIFKDEIVPLTIKRRKDEIVFDTDEYIKLNTNIEKLGKLRTVFKRDGTVTAGNASGINDGSAAVLMMTDEKAKELGQKPLVYIKGFALVGLRPDIMGMGPVYAIRKLQKKLDFTLEQIDLFELNEAFASQSVAVRKELGIPAEKINVNGGAIALGHPIGASGARILVTLIHEMLRRNLKQGIASLCIGTGMGIAILVENSNID
ncbi:MAG: acetyl-CoA C-acetyltransferase [Candidatus Zixiibacteriota bacterium]